MEKRSPGGPYGDLTTDQVIHAKPGEKKSPRKRKVSNKNAEPGGKGSAAGDRRREKGPLPLKRKSSLQEKDSHGKKRGKNCGSPRRGRCCTEASTAEVKHTGPEEKGEHGKKKKESHVLGGGGGEPCV